MALKLAGRLRWFRLIVLTPLLVAAECNEPELTIQGPVFSGMLGLSNIDTLTVINSGGVDARLGPLSDEALGIDPPFALVGGSCMSNPVVAKNGGTCTLDIDFVPRSFSQHRGTLELSYTWGDDEVVRRASFSLAGIVGLSPIVIGDDSFGSRGLDSTTDKAVTVRNRSGLTLTLGDLSSQGLGLAPPFSSGGGTCQSGGTLGPQSSCEFVIRFQPTSIGDFSDAYDVHYNWPESGEPPISAFGATDGRSLPPVTISATPQYFPTTPVGSSSVQRLTVENRGGRPATLDYDGGSNLEVAPPFAISGGTCQSGDTLAASGGSCTIDVRFSPTAQGAALDTLELSYAWPTVAEGFTVTHQLSATGGSSNVNCYETGCAFGEVCVQVTSNPSGAGTCVAVPDPPAGCMAPCVWEARKKCLAVLETCSVQTVQDPDIFYKQTVTDCDADTGWAREDIIHDGVPTQTSYRKNGNTCFSSRLTDSGVSLGWEYSDGAGPIAVTAFNMSSSPPVQYVWCGPYTSSAGLALADAYVHYVSAPECGQWQQDYLSWTGCRSSSPGSCSGL